MAKTKKTKILPLQPISAERYITERARNLPIVKCLIPEELFEKGLGTLLVVRKMASGKFVVGLYMMDVFCLGLKSTNYRFNMDKDDLDELIEMIEENEDLEECPYNEIHNIVYGGIAYAEDLGFKPEKNWKVSQYVLEEDSDDVELIEYEFGKNGRPYYISGPYDAPQKILGILDKTVGKGNYDFVSHVDNEFDFDEEDEELDIDMFSTFELMTFAEKSGFDEEEQIFFDITLFSDPFDLYDFEELGIDVNNLNEAFVTDDNEIIAKACEDLLTQHPNSVEVLNAVLDVYASCDMKEKHALLFEKIENYPDFYTVKLKKAIQLLGEKKIDEARELYGNCNHLKQLYPEKDEFFMMDFSCFYTFQFLYNSLIENDNAAKILLLLMQIDPENSFLNVLEKENSKQGNILTEARKFLGK